MSLTFSDGTDNVLLKLKPWGRPRGSVTFPSDGDILAARWHPSDMTVDDWFRRCVDTIFQGNPYNCAVADNIGLIASIRWEHKTELVYANFQTIIVLAEDLESLYLGECLPCQYMRLDMDLDNLGPLFKEPLPHIHSSTRREPRFAFNMGDSGNLLMDFLEFVYKNYRYDDWIRWVGEVWRKKAPDAGEPDDPLFPIMAAFQNGKAGVLREFEDALQRMKEYLRDAKDSAYPLRLNKEWPELLNYP